MLDISKYNNLQIDVEDNIASVFFNRPQKLNALNEALIDELDMFIQAFQTEKSIVGAIFCGVGDKAFMAGADVVELQNLSPEKAKIMSEKGQKIFLNIELSNKPVIAVINGYALGGGLELAMACHIRIASAQSLFGLPEIKLGVLPGYGGTVRLPALIGKSKALEMMLTGKMINASEACACKLISEILDKENGLKKAKNLINDIKEKSPLIVEKILKLSNPQNNNILKYNHEAEAFASCFYTKDTKEGIEAFLQKRKPNFKGE